MKRLFETLQDCVHKKEDSVLVTIIASSGSTPREAGSRMVISQRGLLFGTIGGGAVEYRSQQMAVDILKEKKSHVKGFKLAPNQVEDLGMICGGDVVVYFQFISWENKENLPFLEKALNLFEKDEDAWIITDITEESAWNMAVYSQGAGLITLGDMEIPDMNPLLKTRAVQVELGEKKYYSEPLIRSGTVYVFGGGHVAQELIPVLSHVGFRCVVMDDRAEFASKELFPTADGIILGDFNKISDYITITEKDYIVVMTRGHAYDYNVEEQVLHTNACYIGVIGSKTKIRAVSDRLKKAGVSDEDIEKVYSPIGLKIKAETPAEIAISIAGEMILVRAERNGK
ncbi:MAG: XdhC family protein [Oscillospiraceae bacterium]|nr:XdhC family protein [Oscillospiraceae bacterium]